MHPGAGSVGAAPIAAGGTESYLAAASSILVNATATIAAGGPPPSAMAAANSDHISFFVNYAHSSVTASVTQITLSVQ